MNIAKLREAVKLITEGIAEDATEQEWAEYGRAVAAAMVVGYSIDSVSLSKTANPNWAPPALRLWEAAGKVRVR